jgi:hypothetical protein
VPTAERVTGSTGVWSYKGKAARLLAVAEPQGDPLSEAELSLIWAGQRFPAGALTGAGGGTVEVLNPGRKGGASGPDFRDAVVRIDGAEARGDVELHLRASYHLQHGHHLDPAYDGLVLHVVFRDDAGGSSPLACGGRVPVAAFEPWLKARSEDIASWLVAPPLWQEPCHDAGARLGTAAVAAEVRRAGEERFRARVRTLAAAVAREGPDEALWQALLDAFGYGGDREGFARLGRALPYALLAGIAAAHPGDEEAVVRAALLAVAGLVPAPDLAAMLPPALSPPLRNIASRPANRPERRLAGAAALALPAGAGGRALASVREARDGAAMLRAWARPAAGVGPSRATEVLLNAVLPFAAAVEPGIAERCLDLAGALPALPPYGKTAFLEANLALPGRRRFARRALEQQGLLALHAGWCTQGGCGRCPLS